jgi:hypothetical protein
MQFAMGHLSDWLSCALFFLSAALLLHHWIRMSHEARTFPAAGIFWLCMASMLCVQIDPIGDSHVFPYTRSFEAFGIVLNARLILLALCCAGAAESLRARGSLFRASATLLTFAAVLSAIFAAYSGIVPLRWGYFATTAVALTTFAALSHALPEKAPLAEQEGVPV